VTRITAIVPATNRPFTLDSCLNAIQGASDVPDEVIVIEEPAALGPAQARNLGAKGANGDVLVFVDADVAVHPDAFTRIRTHFAADPELVAVFGSYDDEPASPGLVSSFRNLLHHHVHHEGPGPATTFWAGLGAVRRDAFEASGGFDELRFPRPSVEDIDLGMRLAEAGGRIELDPSIQGTHLKEWTLVSMLRTDFASRGIPWVVLLLRHQAGASTLNLGWRHRLSAGACLVGLGALATRRRRLAVASAAALVGLNHSFYRLLLKKRGPRDAVLGVGLHALHHLAGVAAVPAGIFSFLRQARKR
jgi:cellulose synthase/poly-beta-1,6-N-acetylglucosamine synthase-like glycosyltransferase